MRHLRLIIVLQFPGFTLRVDDTTVCAALPALPHRRRKLSHCLLTMTQGLGYAIWQRS
jgi:hypothetical protein